MKINGTIFSKPQQDQLRRAITSGGRGLNYKGDWASGNEFTFLTTPVNAPLVLYAHWL